jgi:hypothetical protein
VRQGCINNFKNFNFKVLTRVACETANSIGIIIDVQQDAAVQHYVLSNLTASKYSVSIFSSKPCVVSLPGLNTVSVYLMSKNILEFRRQRITSPSCLCLSVSILISWFNQTPDTGGQPIEDASSRHCFNWMNEWIRGRPWSALATRPYVDLLGIPLYFNPPTVLHFE